jgi:type II secretory pathway component GspD/PulD (secretin)
VRPGFFVDHNDMKKRWGLVSAIFLACFLASVCEAAQSAPGDEPVSLMVEELALGEVLAMITKTTGHEFIIDPQWLDMPVTISVQAIPLHRALKLIFSDLSNAIIYQSNGNIKILIYSEAAKQDKDSVSQSTESPPSPAESESSEAAEPESEPSPESAPEDQTDSSVDSAEEIRPAPTEEQRPAEEQTENTAEETAEAPEEGTEEVAD